MKDKFMKFIFYKLYILILDIFNKYGENKMYELLEYATKASDSVLEAKLGKDGALLLQSEFYTFGEEFLIYLKNEMND